MELEAEIWKQIKNYEGFYEVSNLGRIKSVSRTILRKGKWINISERILLQTKDSRGYSKVRLSINSVKTTKRIHVLVAIAFLSHMPDGFKIIVDHKNNIKSDNFLDNLQLITTRQNQSKDKKKGSSKYTGVCFKKNKNTWQAAIRINGKIKHLGYSKSEEEASLLYQNALKQIEL